MHTKRMILVVSVWVTLATPLLAQDWVYNPANGHRYRLSDAVGWANAEAEAVAEGGHLVTINDVAENQWVRDTFPTGAPVFAGGYWIGFTDSASEGTWVWSSGEPVTFTNWFFGEPNGGTGENCAIYFTYDDPGGHPPGTWNDGACFTDTPGVIEVPPADTQAAFTYQGQVELDGAPLEGTVNMDFALYDVSNAGIAIVSQGPFSVPVSGGLFTVVLNLGAAPFATNESRWLEISVDGTVLQPRQLLTSAPFSLSTRGVIVDDAGNVGIGTTAPTHPLHMASGAHCTAGGVWTDASSRDQKENFIPTDARAILDKVAALPIASWNYKSEDDSTRHVGPMAEDFHAIFRAGADDKHLAALDTAGVALAAIQGLYQVVQERDCQIESLDSEISNLKSEIAELKVLMTRLDALQNGGSP